MKQNAVFGAGCFWGVEETFRRVDGVLETEVGYAGGHVESPRYEDVCRGSTGHAEVTRVVFDDEVIPYQDLLEVFWRCHDPTQVDRQGVDVGSQYRSVIFCGDERQDALARASRARRSEILDAPIATKIEGDASFYRAEEYHQQYFARRRDGGGCAILSRSLDE